MQLVNEFVVPRPIDQTWAVLNDVERIAPAMPGATLTDHVEDVYHGKVKVKVGPVTAQYGGTAQFKERDEAAHHMVLEATGKESSGRGRASALVTADLSAEGAQTRVKVVTDLTISGPLAQFGRGAIAEVSSKLLGQFVKNLETMVLADEPVAPAGAAGAGAAGVAAGAAGVTAGAAPSAPDAAQSTGTPSAGASATAAPSRPPASANGDTPAGPSAGGSASDRPSPGSAAAGTADGSASGAPASAGSPTAPTVTSTAPATGGATAAPSAAPQAGAAASSVPTVSNARPAEAPVAEVNLLKVAAWPILKRLIPVLGVIAVIVIVIVWLAKRK